MKNLTKQDIADLLETYRIIPGWDFNDFAYYIDDGHGIAIFPDGHIALILLQNFELGKSSLFQWDCNNSSQNSCRYEVVEMCSDKKICWIEPVK